MQTLAAPITVAGVSFDAPANCELVNDALICKEDAQQLELSVHRHALAPRVLPADSLARKTNYLQLLHEGILDAVGRNVPLDGAVPFTSYGKYGVMGSAVPGKGTVAAPAVRLASALWGEEVWQFLEIVAVRTPKIEALIAQLTQSATLPSLKTLASEAEKNREAANAPKTATAASASTAISTDNEKTAPVPASPIATFKSALVTFQHPDYLATEVSIDETDELRASFKHKERTGGPNIVVRMRAPSSVITNAAAAVGARRALVDSFMNKPSNVVPLNKLGKFTGSGFAAIGTPDKKKGFSGVESFEATFATDHQGKILEITLTAEQKYAEDAEFVWALLVKTLSVK
jgi:hypothetical protein